MRIDIPVFLIDAVGDRGANPICSPCAEVIVQGAAKSVSVMALLDSGATHVALASEIVDFLDLPVVGADRYFAVGSSHNATFHDACYFLNGNLKFTDRVQSVRLNAEQVRVYQMILGRSFLTNCWFGFDPKRQAWTLSLPTEASKLDSVEG